MFPKQRKHHMQMCQMGPKQSECVDQEQFKIKKTSNNDYMKGIFTQK